MVRSLSSIARVHDHFNQKEQIKICYFDTRSEHSNVKCLSQNMVSEQVLWSCHGSCDEMKTRDLILGDIFINDDYGLSVVIEILFTSTLHVPVKTLEKMQIDRQLNCLTTSWDRFSGEIMMCFAVLSARHGMCMVFGYPDRDIYDTNEGIRS